MLRGRERQSAKNYMALCAEEEAFFKQRSRVQWLSLGDKNTRFFHRSLMHRCSRNTISRLQDDTGMDHYSTQDIGNLAVNYYKKLIGSSNSAREIDIERYYPKSGIFTEGFRGFGSWAGLGLLKYGPADSGLVDGSKAVGRVLVGREVGALFLGGLWMRPGREVGAQAGWLVWASCLPSGLSVRVEGLFGSGRLSSVWGVFLKAFCELSVARWVQAFGSCIFPFVLSLEPAQARVCSRLGGSLSA
ncbi:hypothetical protein DKX38_013602 [Salix brachista]|uniref:Uncharacterized protein n=1 Tax=Salix brachista TaxID=2182728 RepID=A0A5N5LDR9_9ROSI|nr:hypothetical protein DKX38_013602 [Salix brachista]